MLRVLAVFLLLAQNDPTLTGSVVTEMPIARTDGPIPITVTLDWQGAGILQGALELDCAEVETGECHLRRPGIALSRGPQSYRILLPAMTAWNTRRPAELSLRFVPVDDDEEPISLGTHPLQVPGSDLRSLTIGVARPDAGRVPAVNHVLADRLGLDRFDPNRGDEDRLIRTTAAHVPAQGFAAAPLSLLSYDLLVLAYEGFAELSAAQLEVVARWVEGGGSALVLPGPRAIFRPDHAAFLNRLAGGGYRIDGSGAFVGEPASIERFHAGIGRAVVALDADPHVATDDWLEAALFLWKIRAAQAQHIRSTGAWRTDMEEEDRYRHHNYEPTIDYGPQPIVIEETTLSSWLPQDVETLSPGVIFWILAAFVAGVGPGEYLLLGRLRLRRFTWITFPVASVGLSVFLIVLSNVSLGRGDERRTVTIVDVDAAGRTLRWNQYEMMFAGRSIEETRDFEQALLVPMDYQRFHRYSYYGYRDDAATEVEPLRFEGDLPHRWRAVQEVAQWSPQLNRIVSFEPRHDLRPVDWKKLESFDGQVATFQGDGHTWRGGILSQEFLEQLCVRPQRGLFSVVSQISPKAGGDFEDLSLIDPTGSDGRLLVAVYREGDDIVVVRYLESP